MFLRLKMFTVIFLFLGEAAFAIFPQGLRYAMVFTKIWKEKAPVLRILQPFMQSLIKPGTEQ